MASSKHPLHRHSQGYVMTYRRPPVMRRTATTVLAGGPYSGWHNPDDLETLKFDSQSQWDDTATPTESVMNSAAAQPLGFSSSDSAQASTATTTGRRKSNSRAKQKPKQTEQAKAVIDLGASIIPICAPGSGTPPPQPLRSYASSSSLTRSDFDTGASSRMDEEEEEDYLAAAIVGKRSRARSISSQHSTRFPISPPVTSPNASASELPNLTSITKRAREGREPVRRKRRKTTSSMVSTSTRGGDDEAVSLVPIIKPAKPPREREPPRRKGWKGWVMVSDTEGSDTERPGTPSALILEKRTRSGREFDPELPLVQRRARSRASTRTESVAPPSSSGIAT